LAGTGQIHAFRERDAHLGPQLDDIEPLKNGLLDGSVHVGFLSAADQPRLSLCP
jgi:hypothetical protein